MRQILIINDSQAAITVQKALLEKAGYKIQSELKSLNIIETFHNIHMELIILDWHVPNKDEMEVLKEIRSYSELDNIPVIIISEIYNNTFDLKTAFEFGAWDYLKKPIDEIELEARIANAFRLVDYHIKKMNILSALKNIDIKISKNNADLLQLELDMKDREMITVAINIIQNKKFIASLKFDLFEENIKFDIQQIRHLKKIFNKYESISKSLNWDLFEKRYIELDSNFYNNLSTEFTLLTWGELRLCGLFRIGFSIKEIAALNYSNYDAVRKSVYRIRKKLGINENVDINLFFQKY